MSEANIETTKPEGVQSLLDTFPSPEAVRKQLEQNVRENKILKRLLKAAEQVAKERTPDGQ